MVARRFSVRVHAAGEMDLARIGRIAREQFRGRPRRRLDAAVHEQPVPAFGDEEAPDRHQHGRDDRGCVH
jgi:hypothetical protein